MAAKSIMAGNINIIDNCPSPITRLIKLKITLVLMKMLNQVRPNTANARQLAKQAMVLKKILLTKG
jgi:hypothetical protein